MGGDQIACELATRRGLDLKPFALKGCPPMLLTEFRVVLVLKLSMLSPFSLFFEFLVLFHSSVCRVVVCFFRPVWRVAFCQ